MAGKGNISVNQSPQYGDKAVLEEISKATTTTPMSGAVVPRPTAGRPSGGDTPPQPAVEQQPSIDPSHSTAMTELAQSYRTYKFWQDVLAQYPSTWSKMYARESERIYQQKQMEIRNSTPFFR